LIVPDDCWGRFPSSHYDIGFDEGAWNHISRKVYGTFTDLAFSGARSATALALWLVQWAYGFAVYDRLGSSAVDIARRYQAGVVGPLGLPQLAWFYTVAWAAVAALRGKLTMAAGELATSVVAAGLAGLVLANPAGYLRGTFDTLGTASAAVLATGTGQPPPRDGADAKAVLGPLQAQIHGAFVEQPYDYLSWGGPLPPQCAAARDRIVATGPHGADNEPRTVMEAAGCEEQARFNHDPTGTRLFGAVLTLGAAATMVVLLGLVAATVVVAQMVVVVLFAIAPFALLAAVLAGSGRELAWRWMAGLARAVVAVVGMSVVLSLLLLSVTAVLAASGDLGLVERFALVNWWWSPCWWPASGCWPPATAWPAPWASGWPPAVPVASGRHRGCRPPRWPGPAASPSGRGSGPIGPGARPASRRPAGATTWPTAGWLVRSGPPTPGPSVARPPWSPASAPRWAPTATAARGRGPRSAWTARRPPPAGPGPPATGSSAGPPATWWPRPSAAPPAGPRPPHRPSTTRSTSTPPSTWRRPEVALLLRRRRGAVIGTAAAVGCVWLVVLGVVAAAMGVTEPPPEAVAGMGIPPVAFDAYRRAAESPLAAACGMRWQVLAGVGKVESDHARGRTVDADGAVSPAILGLVLDGTGDTASVPDTDDGRLDDDPTWDRAVGPMQFLPATWAALGTDASGDGVADPHNLYDAAAAAAAQLCAGSAHLDDEAQLRAALFSYNRSDAYVDAVVGWIAAYDQGPVDANAVTAAGELVEVRGIVVDAALAPALEALLAAATADGLVLAGGGYRSRDDQIALRRAHCGTSHAAVFVVPAGACSPPTARPGESMHEAGLAVDFTCARSLVSSGDACFAWLTANAGCYGLANLPTEPWHWSTTGR